MTSVDEIVKRVASNKDKWHDLPPAEKLRHLQIIQTNAEAVFEKWGEGGTGVRGYSDLPHVRASGYMLGPATFGGLLNSLIVTYSEIVSYGRPPPPVERRTYNDQEIVTVYPYTTYEKVMSSGTKIELWGVPSKKLEQNVPQLESSACCGVLGAGNFEGFHDLMTKLFVEGKVCVYKTNPVNEKATEPVGKAVFSEMIKEGFVEIVSGGPEVGAEIVKHPLIEELIMTGGACTYDKIVWGFSPEEQMNNKKSGKKLCTKKFDAELGAVSPYIIVPGDWTDAEIAHHTELLVAAKLANSGHVCASPQLIVLDKDWHLRQKFLDSLRNTMKKVLPQPTYYPGAHERCDRFKAQYKQSEVYEDTLRLVFLPDADKNSHVTKEEVFGPLFAEVALEKKEAGVPAFLEAVVDYCNKEVYGSLSCSIIIDPRTEAKYQHEFEDALAKLEWGLIGVNDWAAVGNMYGAAVWGAYPKHDATDIQSGTGKILNARLYSNVQKTVLRSKFMSLTHQKIPKGVPKKDHYRIAWFFLRPTTWRLLSVMSAVLLGW